MTIIHAYHQGILTPEEGEVVQEFPLKLIVNGRELATLAASPHDLRFLVAGFLWLQGFVRSMDDFALFSVCADAGIANVRISGEIPERLTPVLTSGCGGGITFSLPASQNARAAAARRPIPPAAVFALLKELAGRTDRYRTHGGIHSAAVGDGAKLLLYAEDLGRHNTIDRLAGEALFRGIDLAGTLLATSGRVSSEMLAKAALLGVALVASRTSPTDQAVRLAEESGITLVGYVRGERFLVYAHPEGLDLGPAGA